MTNKFYKFFVVFMITALLSCCYYIKYSSPEFTRKFSILQKYENIEESVDIFKDVKLGGIYTNTESGFIEVPDTGETASPLVAALDFIHISDVQLRDERAQLYGRFYSGIADAFVNSTRFAKEQEKYDYSVFKALLLGLNSHIEGMEENKPTFLIHTGDSVHVSLVSELWEFLYTLSTSLKAIPWFNVIGNHDVTVFGTPFLGKSSWLRNPTLAFLPINQQKWEEKLNPENYINFHRCDEVVISGIPIRGPVRECTDLDKFSPGAFNPSFTKCHGFDLNPSSFSKIEEREQYNQERTRYSREQLDLKGYYAFDCKLKKEAGNISALSYIRIIVLNTSEYVSPRAQGGISMQQLEWVREILESLPDQYTRVIAFGHHPLRAHHACMRTDGEHAERLKTLQTLFKDHVDVYFCGHLHKQGYYDKKGFLQVYAPSLLEFPQTGHKVRIKYHQDFLCVEVVPFSHQEMQYQDVLCHNLDRIVTLWEKDEDVKNAVNRIVNLWSEDRYLRRRNINDIAHLWESDERVKEKLDEVIRPFRKDDKVKLTVQKAALLKQAFLARQAAMQDAKVKSYEWLGENYRFYLPLRKISHINFQQDNQTPLVLTCPHLLCPL